MENHDHSSDEMLGAGANGMNGNHMPNTEAQMEKNHSMMPNAVLSNNMGANDPTNPQNWPLSRKLLTSLQAWMFAFTVANGLTCFTAGMKPFVQDFDLKAKIPEQFVGAFSIYLFGIMFAPYWAPHVTERIGRSASYFIYITINALFNLGVGFSKSTGSVLVCRFFAGFFGGPALVVIEGSFAELWPAFFTNSYYAVQGIASFTGAGFGPLFGGYLVTASGGWRWTAFFPVCLAAFALVLGINMPETYQREIPRRHAKLQGKTRSQVIREQEPAQSGVTLAEMATVTVFRPAKMAFTQPVVMLVCIIMFIDWMLTFQWFISVPAALGPAPPKGPGFSLDAIGLAFLTAVVGSIMGALSVILIDQIVQRKNRSKIESDPEAEFNSVEYRVIPAMIGAPLITATYFWIANTVNPNFKPIVPIVGTAMFVWGSAMITFSMVPYTFDLFQPAGTLGAITAQAVGRIFAGAFLPLLILQDISSKLTPKWGLGLFGFISIITWPIPFVLFFYGAQWRRTSKYSMMK